MVSEGMERLISFLKQNQGDPSEQSVEALREIFEQIGNMTKIPKDAKCESLDATGVPAE